MMRGLIQIVGLLLLVFVCEIISKKGPDLHLDPNYREEYRRVRDAHLSFLVYIDGFPSCDLVQGVVKAIKDVHGFISVMTDRNNLTDCNIGPVLNFSNRKEMDFDVLFSISTERYPPISASTGKKFRAHIYQNAGQMFETFQPSMLRGYDCAIFVPSLKGYDSRSAYAGNISKYHLDIGRQRPAVLPVNFFEIQLDDYFQGKIRSVLIDGMLNEPFLTFVHQNLPLLRKRKVSMPTSGSRVALIVEPREHPCLEFVVRNVMLHLNAKQYTQWGLEMHISSGPGGNEKFVRKALHDITDISFVSAMKLDDFRDYNRLLKDKRLWTRLQQAGTEHVLVFQVDSLLIGTDISSFLKFDFIGSPWHVTKNAQSSEWIRNDMSSSSPVYYDACCNGGLSLRNTDAMVNITQKYRSLNPSVNEDNYFSRSAKSLKLNLPSRTIAYNFAHEIVCDDLENNVRDIPYGLHNAWAYVDTERAKALFRASMQSLGLEML
jgi:hypothetical protein